MFEVLQGAVITGYLANVMRIFHININFIFLGNEGVVMFGDTVRNAWSYILLCMRMIC